VIIWINGAFGAGKTTLATELLQRLPDAMQFDPEYVGFILRRWVPMPDSGDFQDIPLWRTMTAAFAQGLVQEYQRPLIVPMTLVHPGYQAEVFGPIEKSGITLLHVFLDLPAAELRRRIDADTVTSDPVAHAWRHRNAERCVAASATVPDGTLVLRADQHPPGALADQVLAALGN